METGEERAARLRAQEMAAREEDPSWAGGGWKWNERSARLRAQELSGVTGGVVETMAAREEEEDTEDEGRVRCAEKAEAGTAPMRCAEKVEAGTAPMRCAETAEAGTAPMRCAETAEAGTVPVRGDSLESERWAEARGGERGRPQTRSATRGADEVVAAAATDEAAAVGGHGPHDDGEWSTLPPEMEGDWTTTTREPTEEAEREAAALRAQLRAEYSSRGKGGTLLLPAGGSLRKLGVGAASSISEEIARAQSAGDTAAVAALRAQLRAEYESELQRAEEVAARYVAVEGNPMAERWAERTRLLRDAMDAAGASTAAAMHVAQAARSDQTRGERRGDAAALDDPFPDGVGSPSRGVQARPESPISSVSRLDAWSCPL